ncbi:hypothetical protein DL96DRAFT_1812072 [Flagelloscypha sp. PMI_526]|nr:hypothetical protein DL96DRAFT_1812072 [Flagelloscypha sp. PMI_526]
MNPTEAALVSAYARGLIGNDVLMAVYTFFYGIYALIFPISAIFLWRRKRSKSTFVMFALSTLVFLLTTVDWITFIYNLVNLTQVGFVELPGSDLFRQFQKAQADIQWVFKLENWPLSVNMSVNDAILVWRVFCLFPHNIWVRASCHYTGLSLTISIGGTLAIVRGDEGNTLSGTEGMGATLTAWIAVSIFTNLVCIGLIGRIAWQVTPPPSVLQFHRKLLLGSKQTSPVQKILSLLVESGVIFICIQVTLFIIKRIERPLLSPQDIAARSVMIAVIVCAAIMPSLVLIVVSQEGSLAHSGHDSKISEWKVAKNTLASQPATFKWNGEADAVRTDVIIPQQRDVSAGEA